MNVDYDMARLENMAGGGEWGGRRRGAGRPRDPGIDHAILDAAVRLLTMRGHEKLAVEEVAERANVSRAALYRRYPSKALLLAAVVERMALTRVEEPDTGHLALDLIALMEPAYDLVTRGSGRVLLRMVQASADDGGVQQLVRDTILGRRARYYAVLDRAIARGELPRDLDHELVIDLLVGPLWTRLLITRSPMPDGLVRRIVHCALHGLVAKPPRKVR
jgi:AcrR family transcriptional regulator